MPETTTTKARAIRDFFSKGPHGRKVEMLGLKALRESPKHYDELAQLCAEALGCTIQSA